MRVTLNLFSGRTNPSWRLSRPQAKELADRITATRAPIVPDEPPKLGFRGFTVRADLEDLALPPRVPPHFVVPPSEAATVEETAGKRDRGRRVSAAAALDAHQGEAADLSRWLLSTAVNVLDDHLLEATDGAMRATGAPRAATLAEHPREFGSHGAAAKKTLMAALAGETCAPFLTPIQVPFWDYPAIRFSNNCYNYATNYASNTLAQPGRRAGRQYTAFECQKVAAAAEFDGYVRACSGQVRVVALGIWPGYDFHWWRLHPGGVWAHKIGTSAVMQFDNLGRPFGNGLTPENCDRGPYTQFCGFLFAPLGVQVW